MILGFWMQGGSVSRRVQSVLNQLGIVCSYDNSCGAIRNFGLGKFLPDADCQGKCHPDGMCHDICLPDE